MGLRVLSLFDGIACGMQAFKELGIPIDVYYASEIEKNAIKVAMSNHPEIVEIGDVTKIDFNEYVGKVDIIIGGSPCQGFSVMGKQLAFKDDCFKTYCTGLPVYKHIVGYYPEHFAFMARCIEMNTVHYLSDYRPSAIEVIGNIHDNPELLENRKSN